jgi:RNAse (barnase) inhibitor barstar
VNDRGAAGPGTPGPGVHRVAGSGERTVQELRDAGWRVVVVRPGAGTADFYADLRRALSLPAWFGANLDALWDSLRDLTGPTALVLTDWTACASAEPGRWRRFLELFAERAGLEPPFAVLLTGAPGPAPQN